MNLNDLPTSILSKIFQNLHPLDWLAIEFVCERWTTILRREFWDRAKELEYETCGNIYVTFQNNNYSSTTTTATTKSKSKSPTTTTKYRLGYSTDELFLHILERIGGNLSKLILSFPPRHELDVFGYELKPATILAIGVSCKSLRSLSLSGHVSCAGDAISVICQDLTELEEIFIWDETFPEELTQGSTTNDDNGDAASEEMSGGVLVGDLVTMCRRQLRSLDVNFIFLPPPSIETCARLGELERIERIRFLFWNPLSPEYVENFFRCVVGCRRTLRDLSFNCKLKAPIDGVRCADYLRRLAGGDDDDGESRLEILDVGFQSHLEMREEYSNEVYYEPIESAPWTVDFVAALAAFPRLNELALRYFQLDNDRVLESLKPICEQLRVFRLEDNYGVDGKLAYVLRRHLAALRWFSLSHARLSHADLIELIVECPNLETMRFSNVEEMSFKRLVLGVHAQLHRCGRTTAVASSGAIRHQILNLKLDTARGYIHDEAEQLKTMQLCGFSLESPGHSNVFIDPVCKATIDQ